MMEERRPGPLPDDIRGRRRYVAFQVISEQKILTQDLINTIWHSTLNLIGEFGASQSDLLFIKNIYDEKKQMGLIRCSHLMVEPVRAALALIQRIGDFRVVIKVIGISGTIKAAMKKFFGEKTLESFV